MRGQPPGSGQRARVAAAVLLLSIAPAARAEAPQAQASMRWRKLPGGDGCVDGAGVRRDVEDALGRHVFVAADEADVRIVGTIGPRRGGKSGWVARLEMRTQDGAAIGVRTLRTRADDCAVLREPLALVLALLVDVGREDIALLVREAPSPPPRLAVGASVATDLGRLPGGGLGLRAHVRFERRPMWPIELETVLYAPRVIEDGPARARFFAGLVGLGVCPLGGVGLPAGLVWSACAGTRLGMTRATGLGFDDNRSGTLPVVDLFARGGLGLRLAPALSLRLGAVLAASLVRAPVTYRDVDQGPGKHELYRPWPLVLGADLGIEIHVN